MEMYAISFLIGVGLIGGIWGVYKIFADVPTEDRSYLDRPPTGFRLTWPFINLFVLYFSRFISESYRNTTSQRLRRAGVEYALSADQYFAGKIVAALFFLGFAFIVQSMLGNSNVGFLMLAVIGGFYYPEIWLKETMDKRNNAIFRALPFYLDIITLSVESGTNLTSGINQAVSKAPDSPLRVEFARVLRDIRAGRPRSESLRDLTERVSSEGLNNVVSSMIQAEKTGASLGSVLRAQSDQLRSSRFLKAEKMAMEAPVKLLGPLIMFIFPTTFIVIGFVLLSKAVLGGVITWPPLVWAFTNPA